MTLYSSSADWKLEGLCLLAFIITSTAESQRLIEVTLFELVEVNDGRRVYVVRRDVFEHADVHL